MRGLLLFTALAACTASPSGGSGAVTTSSPQGETGDVLAVTTFDPATDVFVVELTSAATGEALARLDYDLGANAILFAPASEPFAISYTPTAPELAAPVDDVDADEEAECLDDVAGIADAVYREWVGLDFAGPEAEPEIEPVPELPFGEPRWHAPASCPQACWKGDHTCTSSPDFCPWTLSGYDVASCCETHDDCYYDARTPQDLAACNAQLGTCVYNSVWQGCTLAGRPNKTCLKLARKCGTRYNAGTDIGGGGGCNAYGKKKELEYCLAALKNTGPGAWTCATRSCVCEQCVADFPSTFPGVTCGGCPTSGVTRLPDPKNFRYAR
jgi:hypothetical protein